MNRPWFVVKTLLLAAVLVVGLEYLGSARAESTLTIGSKAPKLNISDWFNLESSKLGKVTQFEPGKVYVVEFWATWCGPCIQSMPHLASLQQKYLEKGVQIISISDEDVETIQEFLAREVQLPSGKDSTFAELTSQYSLTTDPDGSSSNDYLRAANQNGIPCAFLVGKDGVIEWIGHPMELDEPLEAVVTGTWDREAYKKAFQEEQDLDALREKIGRQLFAGAQQGPPSEEALAKAFEAIESFQQTSTNPRIKTMVGFMKFELMVQFRPNDPKMVTVFDETLPLISANPLQLNGVAWGLYELSKRDHFESKELLVKALAATEKSIVNVPNEFRGTVYDTIAHIKNHLGDRAGAIEAARAALKAPDADKQMEEFLQSLEEALKE